MYYTTVVRGSSSWSFVCFTHTHTPVCVEKNEAIIAPDVDMRSRAHIHHCQQQLMMRRGWWPYVPCGRCGGVQLPITRRLSLVRRRPCDPFGRRTDEAQCACVCTVCTYRLFLYRCCCTVWYRYQLGLPRVCTCTTPVFLHVRIVHRAVPV